MYGVGFKVLYEKFLVEGMLWLIFNVYIDMYLCIQLVIF